MKYLKTYNEAYDDEYLLDKFNISSEEIKEIFQDYLDETDLDIDIVPLKFSASDNILGKKGIQISFANSFETGDIEIKDNEKKYEMLLNYIKDIEPILKSYNLSIKMPIYNYKSLFIFKLVKNFTKIKNPQHN
jgi:hypothetical protein